MPKNKFHVGIPTLDELFYHTNEDKACVVYSEFQRKMNADAIETFCKVAKDVAPEKLTGIFFGYITEPEVCANPQHSGFEQILASPYIDFLASPKGYHRVGPTDPGLGQAVPNSVNRKKLWVDEIDNRTHLCKTNNPKDFPAKNFDQTRAVYWREFTENVAYHQGYWWMDLMGGWLDSEEIRDEIALLNKTSERLYLKRDSHKSVTEVLLVIDDNTVHHMRPNFELHKATINHTGSTIKESGVPTDLYRLADLDEIDLSGYKMIVFLNAFSVDIQKLKKTLERVPKDCSIMWNYTPGIVDLSDNSFGVENVEDLTGFKIMEYPKNTCVEFENLCYPVISIEETDGVIPVEFNADGRVRLAKCTDKDGRTHILSAMPTTLNVDTVRKLLNEAGVHIYAPEYCTVNADNRFVYVLAEREMTVKVDLKETATCKNVFTGEVYRNAQSITFNMEEGTCIFLEYI